MKHIVKILSLVIAITALWVGLLQTSIIPQSHTWLLPIYFVVSLGCYGLLMVGVGLMNFPTCPQEALLLQKVLWASESSSVGFTVFGPIQRWGAWPPSHGFREYTY
ncbi:dolichol-phosphate mannosyltransferase-like protein [Medicago truncatula]|uniref:Dolichol-phosphate mannosyltransferase subunit 3 n=1 Tax=Medicago truncatula TaxID=3880 RepID=A0A072UUX0_MEDTR|nr:dolichol-phosphate mannosyltransferase-like protein [Medicago truncatula]